MHIILKSCPVRTRKGFFVQILLLEENILSIYMKFCQAIFLILIQL